MGFRSRIGGGRTVGSLLLFVLSTGLSLGQEPLKLTLDDALQLASERNLSSVVAELKVEEAKASLDASRSAFFPQVNLNGSYTYLSYAPVITQKSPVAVDTTTFELIWDEFDIEFGYPHNFSFGVSVNQTLFTWGRLLNAYGLSQANLRASELDRLGAEEDVRVSTKEAYYSALFAERYLTLVQEMEGELRAHYDAVNDRYEAGVVSDLELMRAEVQLNNVRPQLLEAQAALDLSFDFLKLTIGVPQSTAIELVDELAFEDYEMDLDSLIEIALESRYDLKATEKRVDMLGKAAAIQRAGDKPTLFASWSYTYGRPYYYSDDWDGSWSATLGFTFPLFDGFRAHAQGRETGAQLNQLRHTYEFQREMAVLEVTSAWKNLKKARETLKSQEYNVDLARKTFDMFEEQYMEGFVSSLDVLDAEVMYSQARLGYISALRDYLVSRAKLERAVKGGSSTSGTDAEGSSGVPMDSETGESGGASSPEGSLQGLF